MRWRMLNWIGPIVGLAAILAFLVADASFLGGRTFGLGAYTSVQFVLNTNASALASTLGILMAIVLLMVQLTAQRYSFNIIGMFVKNPRNVALIVLFIVTITFNIWIASSIDEDYIPVFGTYLALGLGTLCFALLLPYFSYLFDSLSPRNLLEALEREAVGAVEGARTGARLPEARRQAAEKVQHMGDITRTSVSVGDADVACHSVWVLHNMFRDYLVRKPELPREWFTVEDRFFRGRHALVLQETEEGGTWFERRIFEELQTAFSTSLNRLEAVNTTVALCCRLAGEYALERDDEAALRLLIKFLNTFLRAALNARDARAGYHLLYQYALLAESSLETRPDLAHEITDRIAYYGETALGSGVYWMAIAAAQDIRSLCEACVRRGLPREVTGHLHESLVHLIGDEEGTRLDPGSPVAGLLAKAILALGAYYVHHGEQELARDLSAGLAPFTPRQLSKLVNELAGVVEPAFWELTDRVVNFEYVEEGPRARLGDFVALVAERQPDVAQDRARPVEVEASASVRSGKPGAAADY